MPTLNAGSLSGRRTPRGRTGFTLIEMMIALFIFGMMATLFGALMPIAGLGCRSSGSYAQAALLAQHKADQVRQGGFHNLTGSRLVNLGVIDANADGTPMTTAVPSGLPTGTTSYSFTGVDTLVDSGTNGTILHPFSATADGSSLKVRITWDITNTGSVQKHHVVDSTATTASGTTATMRAYVQQSSFGKYAVFLDSTPPGAYWASGLNVFDGPIHSNNSNNGSPATPTGALNNVVWSDGTGVTPKPVFTYQGNDAFTVSSSSINWMRNSYGNLSSPATEAEWRMVATGGSTSVQTGVPMITMPASSASRQYAALGQSVPIPPAGSNPPGGLPNTFGVTVPHSGGNGPTVGGTYIHGDVQQINLSVDPGDSKIQIIQVKQADSSSNPYTTTFTLDGTGNSTAVHVDSMVPAGNGSFKSAATDNSYSGVTNGVVYCDGNVGGQTGTKTGGVSGVIADQCALTLATNTSHNVNIDGSLTYKTPRQKDGSGNLLPESDPANAAFRANASTLGIVSQNVEVVDKDTSGNWIQNEEVDAAVMAFGTYDAADYATRPLGQMLNMGTYIVKTRGLFSTGNGFAAVSGIPCSHLYDNRLANNLPPFFPTTSSHYDIVSWQRAVMPLP